MTDTRRRDAGVDRLLVGTVSIGGERFLYIADDMRRGMAASGISILANDDRKAIAERGRD